METIIASVLVLALFVAAILCIAGITGMRKPLRPSAAAEAQNLLLGGLGTAVVASLGLLLIFR